jgi:hypothetical protein
MEVPAVEVVGVPQPLVVSQTTAIAVKMADLRRLELIPVTVLVVEVAHYSLAPMARLEILVAPAAQVLPP